MLYKYPQVAFPYRELVEENRSSRELPELELLDLDVFADNRYFDVFVEFAKASEDDTLIDITVWNRGPEAAAAVRVAADLVSKHVVLGACPMAQAFHAINQTAARDCRTSRTRGISVPCGAVGGVSVL